MWRKHEFHLFSCLVGKLKFLLINSGKTDVSIKLTDKWTMSVTAATF